MLNTLYLPKHMTIYSIQCPAVVLGVKQNLTFCENGSLCTHSNFFRVKNKINCALTIHKHN